MIMIPVYNLVYDLLRQMEKLVTPTMVIISIYGKNRQWTKEKLMFMLQCYCFGGQHPSEEFKIAEIDLAVGLSQACLIWTDIASSICCVMVVPSPAASICTKDWKQNARSLPPHQLWGLRERSCCGRRVILCILNTSDAISSN